MPKKEPAEKAIRDIQRKTRQKRSGFGKNPAVLLLTALITASACERAAPPLAPPFAPPAPLIGDFESGISLQQARSVESAKGLRWEVVEQSRYSAQSSGKELVVVLAKISGYSHYGVSGDLHLLFNNDLLTRAEFYPSRLDDYLAEYEKREGVKLRDTGLGYQKGDTWIWLWMTPGEEFIGWRDERMTDYFRGSD